MNNWKRTFAIIWSGQFVSILSSTVINFAIILWLSIETGSAEVLAYSAIAAMLPQALLGPACGVYIDRWSRKQVMILADSFIAVCTLVLAVLFAYDVAQLWHIYILLALRSVGSAFHMPAMQASVPLIAPAEELTRVAGISQMIHSVGNIAGPALGALFISIWKMEYILLLDVAGAAVACISLLFVGIPNPEKTVGTTPHVLREMKEGVMAVMKNRGLRLVFLFSVIVTLFLMPVSVLFPLMTLDHFSGDAFQVSLIEVVWGIGALAGGLVMGARTYKVNRVLLVNCMYLLIGLTFTLSGLLPGTAFVWFAVLTTVAGISGAVYNSSFTALVQSYIDPSALGRVFSMFYTLSLIPSMVGLIFIGFFADYIGLTQSFVLCGSIIILTGAIAFFFPSAMKLDKRK